MRKLLGVMALITAFGLGSGAAMADTTTNTGYNSSYDTTIGVALGGVPSPSDTTGTTTFQTQEAVYSTTGADVPHDYVWLDVNGVPVLAVDPPAPMINRTK